MSSREDQAQKGSTVNGAAEEAESRIFALDPGEGEAWWWMGGLATVKATTEQTGGRYTLVEVLVPEFPMEESLLHVHHFEDEGFYVLEGELTFYVGDETIKASPGSFLFGPKDVPHRYTVESGPAKLLFILSPAGLEEFIYAPSDAVPPAAHRAAPCTAEVWWIRRPAGVEEFSSATSAPAEGRALPPPPEGPPSEAE